jgi:hypothetical protein
VTAPPTTGPDRLKDLWLPLGPATVTEGQAWDLPNVTGRVVDIQVSPSGTRVYAAAAGGGVWYSGNEGASWLALGAWVTTPQADQLDYFANTLACGSVAVAVWDTALNGENDTVFVGTGEITPQGKGTPGSQLGGVGVLTAVNPVAQTRADPFAAVWTREAKMLEGRGVYRLAIRPEHPAELLAAASDGLYLRSGPDNWTKVTAKPFDKPRIVTDVLWTATHIWVALDSAGVWRADLPTGELLIGEFEPIDLSSLRSGRIALAAADGSVVYALGTGPRLWRITGTTATLVGNVPAALFDVASAVSGAAEEETPAGHPNHELPEEVVANQASYDIAMAVDPDHPDQLVLGGAAVGSLLGKDLVLDAALFRCTVQNPGSDSPTLNYNPTNDLQKGGDPKKITPANDPTFIGKGVHPDVHGLAFSKRAGTLDLWVTCDGGIYRSTRGGRNLTWQARNNGLAAVESGYVACHPTSDALLVVGTQDTGVLQRTGETTWKTALKGDGGGVAFNPADPDLYVVQSHSGTWGTTGQLTQPVHRSGKEPPTDDEKEELVKTNFYSSPGVVATTTAHGVRLAIGTNRVWASEDFGVTWFTLPTNSDPRNLDLKRGPNTDQDVFYDDARAVTLACRWKDENELYVLNKESIQRLSRAPLAGVWTRGKAITDHRNKCFRYSESDIDTPNKMPYLPPLGDWSDLALHQPGPDGSSSLYVACTSLPGKLKMDTLWWYDGSHHWWATKLRDAVKAPALAVAVHPVDRNTVYVGTTVGVWRGALHLPPAGGAPFWDWSTFSIGLPEAAVQDLAFYREPAGGAPTMLLLRAALQARGVWEVDLLDPCDEQTYLRVHALDSRRPATTSLANPAIGPPSFAPFLSPDILIRPAPPVNSEPAPEPRPDFFPIDENHHNPSFELWTFQTAFRQLEPACRPTGSWSDTFKTLLVDYKQSHGLGALPRIDWPTWKNAVTQTRVYAPPWAGATPTEADFMQLVMDEHNVVQRVQPATLPAKYTTRRLKVDVLVHQRGLAPVKAADVSVLLLMRELPHTWPMVPPWPVLAIDADWKQSTVLALASGGSPEAGWTDGWEPGDPTLVRHPPHGADLSAATPQAVTFDLALPTAMPKGNVMLLAVCSSPTATLVEERLPGDNLRDLVAQSKHVAAHVLELANVQPPAGVDV